MRLPRLCLKHMLPELALDIVLAILGDTEVDAHVR